MKFAQEYVRCIRSRGLEGYESLENSGLEYPIIDPSFRACIRTVEAIEAVSKTLTKP